MAEQNPPETILGTVESGGLDDSLHRCARPVALFVLGFRTVRDIGTHEGHLVERRNIADWAVGGHQGESAR